MKKSSQFWQDVDMAICTLILRQSIHQIIIEGRQERQPLSEITFNDAETIFSRFQAQMYCAPSPGRDGVFYDLIDA